MAARLSALSCALVFLLSGMAFGAGYSPDDKSKFQKSDYSEVFANRGKYSSSRARKHRRFEIMFNGVAEKLPNPFSSFGTMAQKYWKISFSGEKRQIPILFNRKNKKLLSALRSLPSSTPIIVYADVSYKKKNKKKHYFLELAGFDSIQAEIKDSDDGKKDYDEKDFMAIKHRRLDIQPSIFLNRKVRFSLKFKGISNALPSILLKGGLNPEKVFLLKVDDLLTPIVVDKNNSECVETIIDADINDKLAIFASLRKFELQAGRAAKVYYLVPVSISNESKVVELRQ